MKNSTHFPYTLYNNVKKFRKAQNYSLSGMAEQVGVSRTTLYRIERAEVIPSILIALRIAEYLRTSINELFTLEKETILTPTEKFLSEQKAILQKIGRWYGE